MGLVSTDWAQMGSNPSGTCTACRTALLAYHTSVFPSTNEGAPSTHMPQESGTLKKSLAGEMESAGSEIEPQNHIKSKPSGCDGMQSQPSTEEVGRARALGLTGQST